MDKSDNLKGFGQKVAAEMVRNIQHGAATNTKWMKDNGWQDKRLPAEQKTISPLLGGGSET